MAWHNYWWGQTALWACDPTVSNLSADTDLADVDMVILFGSRFDARESLARWGRLRRRSSLRSMGGVRRPTLSTSDLHGRTRFPRRGSALTGTSPGPH